jgi:hypothetical protein
VVFKMIAEPLLLTWEQLFAMPAMRKRAGRGGKAACLKQRELRAFCFENNIARVDLGRSAYNWRILLKTIPCLNTPDHGYLGSLSKCDGNQSSWNNID